jgi:hypothetical protein
VSTLAQFRHGFERNLAEKFKEDATPMVAGATRFLPMIFAEEISRPEDRGCLRFKCRDTTVVLQAEKEDQEMAEACKRLIKNCIICWNYLYLSQKLEEIEDAATRQVFLDAVAHGSVISWQHINLLGEYDFSDEKLQDNVGIRPPKLTP